MEVKEGSHRDFEMISFREVNKHTSSVITSWETVSTMARISFTVTMQ